MIATNQTINFCTNFPMRNAVTRNSMASYWRSELRRKPRVLMNFVDLQWFQWSLSSESSGSSTSSATNLGASLRSLRCNSACGCGHTGATESEMEVLLNWPDSDYQSTIQIHALLIFVETSCFDIQEIRNASKNWWERCDMLERSKEYGLKNVKISYSKVGWIQGRPKSVGISARVLRFDLDTISNGMQWPSRKGRTNRLHRTHLSSLVKSCKVIESYSAIIARSLLFDAIILRHLNWYLANIIAHQLRASRYSLNCWWINAPQEEIPQQSRIAFAASLGAGSTWASWTGKTKAAQKIAHLLMVLCRNGYRYRMVPKARP